MVPAALILDMQSMERAGEFLGQADSWHIMSKAVGEMGEAFTPGGALETHGHKQGLCGSSRLWDGQDGY